MKELSTEQMAGLNGVLEQALRLYNKMGLFSPICQDRKNRYRYYDIRQSTQLDMIQHMKALGMSLKDIREQMEYSDSDMLRNTLYRSLDAIDQKAQELIYRRRVIERTLKSYGWYKNTPPDGTIVLEYVPHRLTYVTDSGTNFYDRGVDVYEKILRELKKSLVTNQLSPIYFYNAGAVMKKKALLAGQFCSAEIFVLTDKGSVNESLITQIPASTYLCIYYDSFDEEKDYTERLPKEIRTREYRITEDYICEMVAEVPMDMQERGMFLRLQVLVFLRARDV